MRKTAVEFPNEVVVRHVTARNLAHVLHGLGGNRQPFERLLRDRMGHRAKIAFNFSFGQHPSILPTIPISQQEERTHRATTLTTWATHSQFWYVPVGRVTVVLATPSVLFNLLLLIVGVALFDEECANLFPQYGQVGSHRTPYDVPIHIKIFMGDFVAHAP